MTRATYANSWKKTLMAHSLCPRYIRCFDKSKSTTLPDKPGLNTVDPTLHGPVLSLTRRLASSYCVLGFVCTARWSGGTANRVRGAYPRCHQSGGKIDGPQLLLHHIPGGDGRVRGKSFVRGELPERAEHLPATYSNTASSRGVILWSKHSQRT